MLQQKCANCGKIHKVEGKLPGENVRCTCRCPLDPTKWAEMTGDFAGKETREATGSNTEGELSGLGLALWTLIKPISHLVPVGTLVSGMFVAVPVMIFSVLVVLLWAYGWRTEKEEVTRPLDPHVLSGILGMDEEPIMDLFDVHVDDFLSFAELHDESSEGRYVKGRCVVIADNEVDDYLTRSWHNAVVPEEVSTVIRLTYHSKVLGYYDRTGSPAVDSWVDIAVIDIADTTIVARKTFHGVPPPDRRTAIKVRAVGGPPTKDEIWQYFLSLPWRLAPAD